MNIPNRITLDTLDQQPIGGIIALPAEDLTLLQAEVEKHFRKSKLLRDWFNGALTQKYEHRAQAERLAASKDSGTVRFQDGSVTVIADAPKRIEWDQAALVAMTERIRAAGDDPAEYVEISCKLSERKYLGPGPRRSGRASSPRAGCVPVNLNRPGFTGG